VVAGLARCVTWAEVVYSFIDSKGKLAALPAALLLLPRDRGGGEPVSCPSMTVFWNSFVCRKCFGCASSSESVGSVDGRAVVVMVSTVMSRTLRNEDAPSLV